MANDRFTTHCPSCEATVAVRTASVGKKIECPKCKFQFVVADSGGGGKAEKGSKAEKADKGDPKGKAGKSKTKASGGNSKMIIGVVVGVIALAVLSVGAYLVFGGDGKPTANAKGNGSPSFNMTKPTSNDSGTAGGPSGGNDTTTTGGDNPMGGGDNPMGAGGETKVAAKPASTLTNTGADVTNLLPNDSRSVLHINMEGVEKTHLKRAFFDKANQELIERSLKIKHGDIAEVVHCYVGQDRDPFVVLRTKVDLDEKIVSQPHMDTKLPEGGPVKGRNYRIYNSNAFVTAVGQSINFAELVGVTLKPGPVAADKKYAVSLYDSRTMLIAESATLQRFLTDLGEDGFPTFKTDYKKLSVDDPVDPNAPPAEGGATGGGGPGEQRRGNDEERRRSGGQQQPGGPPAGVGKGPGGPPGAPPAEGGDDERRRRSGQQQQPGGPGGGMADGGPGGGAPSRPKARKPITSNPSFRSVDPILKKALNQLQDESGDTPAVLMAFIVDQRILSSRYDLKGLLPMRPEAGDNPLALDGIMSKVRVAGAALSKLTDKKGSMVGYLEYADSEAAKSSVTEFILPVLEAAKFAYFKKFNEPLAVRDMNKVGTSGGSSGGEGGFPGGPSGGFPGGGNRPGGPPAGGGLAPLPPPGSPGGGPGGGPSGKSPDAESPRGRQGGQDEEIQGKGGLRPLGPPGSPGGGGGGGEQGPGPGGPPEGMGGPGGESGFPSGTTPTGSRIDVYQSDSVVTFTCEFSWKLNAYNSVVVAAIDRTGALVRGKIALLSGESTLAAFSNREFDGRPVDGALKRAITKNGQLPQGALDRDIEGNRRGLQYPPDQRCSFIVELLPFLGERASWGSKIETRKQPWHSPDNLQYAEAWVPELLVTDYPSSAWRATSDMIPDGRTVGATNYVGLAGVSLDAARFDPKNPADAKKVGLMGYGWSSKPEEVTDGLANTIFMIQVPPGLQRPWIAGGGSTLMGVDDRGNEPARPFMVKRGDGSRSTTVLMGDGSIRTVREGVDPAIFRAMATRAGGESIPDLDKTAPKAGPAGIGELRTSK